jgi:hypothetical protein
MSLFNGVKQSDESAKKREVKERVLEVDEIVREVLKIAYEDMPPVGVLGNADHDVYDKLAEKVIKIMLEHKMKYSNRHFFFQLVLQVLENMRDRVVNALGTTFEKMVDRAVGKDALDVTLEDMDNIIKAQSLEKN